MDRNRFVNSTQSTPTRVWVGVGEIWSVNAIADYDAIYIQSRNDEGTTERYLVYYLQEVKKRVESESHRVRGQRFLGVSANSMYEPPQQRIDDSDLSRFQNLLGKYDYVTLGNSENITKDAIVSRFNNNGVFDSSRIQFTRR